MSKPQMVSRSIAVRDRAECWNDSRANHVNPAVSALIADYFEVPEVEADGLLIHLRINGWQVVAIQEDEDDDAT
jgi:hypothetical protein